MCVRHMIGILHVLKGSGPISEVEVSGVAESVTQNCNDHLNTFHEQPVVAPMRRLKRCNRYR